MKWIFRKENDECMVRLKGSQGEESDFSYINMMKVIYQERELQEPEFDDGFSDEEKESILNLVKDINNSIKSFFARQGEETSE